MSQTVDRALTILDFIADEPRTLAEITQHLGAHKTTAWRLLQALEARGYARQLENGRYMTGFHFIASGVRAIDRVDLRRVANPHLIRLSERYGHTFHLAELVDGEIYYLDKVDGHGALKLHSRVGSPAILHTSGVAKAVLAFLPAQERAGLLERVTYQRYTDRSITSPSVFAEVLEATRQRGWAEDDGEFEEFISCVAVPITDESGDVRASMSITAVKALVSLEKLRKCVPDLIDTATQISHEMGWYSSV